MIYCSIGICLNQHLNCYLSFYSLQSVAESTVFSLHDTGNLNYTKRRKVWPIPAYNKFIILFINSMRQKNCSGENWWKELSPFQIELSVFSIFSLRILLIKNFLAIIIMKTNNNKTQISYNFMVFLILLETKKTTGYYEFYVKLV